MKDKIGILKALALLSQVGITIIVPIIAGVWLGNYLDQLLGTNILFLILCILSGVFIGFRNAYKLLASQQDSGK
ncbi:Putative F0F1-ATPase subunit (ATPase_gene1) [Halobacteroides halobius DSM 5150]|uniref:Putative F0F1-ATPase subunit (ATPase_gene1) n=1 Tax=Halobacteroides halobius (strain ATCC 35273 / DSM 5150 / MD-1) TaxID=748449 RepID=L0KBH2_HALHC|nr:AtpZ/AtpI family protein [Halobacteroides halobius]AGB42341.1 Putative F0F1-ATPase subunit (ATPase_gene1) [Halobacteroides halobius DSM 5150]